MANKIWDFMGGIYQKTSENDVRVVCFSLHKINPFYATPPIPAFEMVLQTPHIHYKNDYILC